MIWSNIWAVVVLAVTALPLLSPTWLCDGNPPEHLPPRAHTDTPRGNCWTSTAGRTETAILDTIGLLWLKDKNKKSVPTICTADDSML